LRKHPNAKKSAGKVDVSVESEPEPVHIMSRKQFIYEVDVTRSDSHKKKFKTGFYSVALDAAMPTAESKSRHIGYMHEVSCLLSVTTSKMYRQ
jgi:hypothetical protein